MKLKIIYCMLMVLMAGTPAFGVMLSYVPQNMETAVTAQQSWSVLPGMTLKALRSEDSAILAYVQPNVETDVTVQRSSVTVPDKPYEVSKLEDSVMLAYVQPSTVSAVTVSQAPVRSPDKTYETPEQTDYVTRRELAVAVSKASGEKHGKISELTFSKDLDKPATMADLVETLFHSNMMKNDVEIDKVFLGKPITKIYK